MPREQYEVRWQDYYELLQVHPRADAEVISAAYRKLARRYHPDLNKDPKAVELIKLINAAYEVLSDPERRATYDAEYEARQARSSHGGSNGTDGTDGREEARGQRNGAHESRESAGSRPGPHGFQEDHYQEDDWYWTPGEDYGYGSPPAGGGEESEGMRARAWDWVSHGSHEAERILPWPSWQAQRVLLFLSIPFGTALAVAGPAAGSFLIFAVGLLVAGGAVYAGLQTGWLGETSGAPVPARVAGGASVAVTGLSAAALALYVAAMIALFVLAGFIACAVIKGMLEESLKSK